MMAKISSQEFIECVERSKLADAGPLDEALLKCEMENGGQLPKNPDAVADFLMSTGLLTAWHCEKLLKKKYRGFFLGKYKLLRLIGTGGMSSVYLAEHTLLQQQRAIKVLPKSRVADTSYVARFQLEAQVTASLDHPNVVRAYDVDHERDTHYLVMEYIDGRDLAQQVNGHGPLEIELAVNFTIQAAEGLQCAHEAGLIHRDVKPGNLLLDSNGVVKILDLGLALDSKSQNDSLTIAHNEKVLGTADYLAPEQALNSHTIDSRADVYGLGCTMYFLITGEVPFAGGSLAQRIMKHQNLDPPDLAERFPKCPRSLADICLRMLAKSPENRYQTMREVADTLNSWLHTNTRVLDSSSTLSLTQSSQANTATPETAFPQLATSPSPHLESSFPELSPAKRDPESGTSSDTIHNRKSDRDTVKVDNRRSGSPPTDVKKDNDQNENRVELFVQTTPPDAMRTGRFSQRRQSNSKQRGTIPIWVWVAGAILILTTVALAFWFQPDRPHPPPETHSPSRRDTSAVESSSGLQNW